jgi:hypothetical protein
MTVRSFTVMMSPQEHRFRKAGHSFYWHPPDECVAEPAENDM